MQHDLGHDFRVGSALVIVDEEQIDVGVGVQLGAAITTPRHDAKLLMQLGVMAGVLGVGVAEQRTHHVVDGGGVFAHHFGARRAGEVMLRDFLANHFEIDARDLSGRAGSFELQVECFLAARNGVTGGVGRRGRDGSAHRFPAAASELK